MVMMNIKEDLSKRKEFWEKQHRTKNLRTLSGCSLDETLTFLQVRELVQPKVNFLEMGVGMGHISKALYDHCFVSALDISQEALERVWPYCVATYNLDQIKELPTDYFDVIICHNLVQHIPTDLLIVEFIEIIRSLKPGGVFAVGFVSTDNSEDTGKDLNYKGYDVGCYCRTPEWMKRMVKSMGANAELKYSAVCNIDIVKGTHVIHITK
jgi:2-polyprenyl-3-methyl-5-hydroxy-6-metoxy-1,4-benzoquinol methylase